MADETREESEAIDLASSVIGLHRSGEARLLETSAGPPRRIDGYTVGAPFMSREPPHGGEMHPDADELLFLVSGLVTVILEDRDPPRHIVLTPGQALIVPRGIWHRVRLEEPSQLLHVTPGPGGAHRPPK
jgi:mannose-6-phosphate isomerase-like protein (cupin superfamily)